MKFLVWSLRLPPNEGLPMINKNLIRAASRLSPQMFAYHLKRAARNRIARKSPGTYQRYIDGKVASLPAFKKTGRENTSLAEKVAAFYAPEYRDHADDAAQGVFTLFGQRVDFGAPETSTGMRRLTPKKTSTFGG